jgi:hypothetical protein
MDAIGGLNDSAGWSVAVGGTRLAVGGTRLAVVGTRLAVGGGEDPAVGAEAGAPEQAETTNAATRTATRASFK